MSTLQGRRRSGRTVQLTERDGAVLRDLTRFATLTVEQVARRHFQATNTAANRLALLIRAGYVRVERPRFRGRAAYLVTNAGARAAGVGLPAPRFAPLTVPHQVVVAELAFALLQAHPEADWRTERELRRDSMQTVRDRRYGRLVDGTPHVPDGLLLLSPIPVAIEVELAGKTQYEYERVLRRYATGQPYGRVAWYCASPAVERRLGALIAHEQMDDFMTVAPLPPGIDPSPWG